MQEIMTYKTVLQSLNDEDQEALNLFNHLDQNPNSQPSHQNDMIQHPNEPLSEEQNSTPRLTKLTKLKKSKQQSKKQKRHQKKHGKKLKNMMRLMESDTPKKKLKRDHSSKKKRGSDQQAGDNHEDKGSSQFDSESEKQGMQLQLQNLNPDASQDVSPKRRLRKSNKKSKIQERQGFRVEQLGLDPQMDLQKLGFDHDEDSFSEAERKRKNKKMKIKAKVLTNQEIMNNFKDHGVVESQGEEREGVSYDNGLDMLNSMKDKKKKGIKINNRMFDDLNIDFKDEQAHMPPPENLQLELKPKTSGQSSERFSFLLKAQNIKKQRGLQANVDKEQYERKAQQKAKQSMAKIILSMVSQQYHQELDLQVKMPAIAKGKSGDIINNTVFLQRFMSKNQSSNKEEVQTTLYQTKSCSVQNNNRAKKDSLTRNQLFKQIQEQTRLRRSKYISDEELKNSFKKTNLQELEEARKRIQQKKRKQMLSDHQSQQQESDDEDFNSEDLMKDKQIIQAIEKEEQACNDRQAKQKQATNQQKGEMQELQIEINIEAQMIKNNNNSPKKATESEQVQQNNLQDEDEEEENEVVNQQINQYNQIIEELASASHHQQQQQNQDDQEMEDHQQMQAEDQKDSSDQQKQVSKEPQINPQMLIQNQQEVRQQQELEDQGIIMKKRKRIITSTPEKFKDQAPQLQLNQVNKQNLIDATNKNQEYEQNQTPINNKQIASEDNEQQFKNFRKLRKIAMVIAEKKKEKERGMKYAQQFIQQQAEEGSDNEDHDDIIKNIDRQAEDKEYEGLDLDQDLVELIDNAVDIDQENQQQAFRKYLQDVRIQDREEIKKIIRGQFKKKHEDLDLQVDEDERKRQQRMEEVINWMKKRQEEQGEGIFLKMPEQEVENSDDDSQFGIKKKHVEEEQAQDSQRIPIEQEKAMLEKFIEDTLPSVKKQYKPTKILDLGALPESFKIEKSSSSKTISMSRLGSKNNQQKNQNSKPSKTSSLVNQILNRKSSGRSFGNSKPLIKSKK